MHKYFICMYIQQEPIQSPETSGLKSLFRYNDPQKPGIGFIKTFTNDHLMNEFQSTN